MVQTWWPVAFTVLPMVMVMVVAGLEAGVIGKKGVVAVRGSCVRMDVSALSFMPEKKEDRHWRKVLLCQSRLLMWAANSDLLLGSRRWPGRQVGW